MLLLATPGMENPHISLPTLRQKLFFPGRSSNRGGIVLTEVVNLGLILTLWEKSSCESVFLNSENTPHI